MRRLQEALRPALALVAILALDCGGEAARGPEQITSELPHAAVGPPQSPAATAERSPMQRRMEEWAEAYRANGQPIARAISLFEISATPGRRGCNMLIDAVYSAKIEVPMSPDPDIQKAVTAALDQLSEAGSYCLQGRTGFQDTFLLIGRGGFSLVESLLSERYDQAGVPGLGEPMDGGTAIGERAVAFARQAQR